MYDRNSLVGAVKRSNRIKKKIKQDEACEEHRRQVSSAAEYEFSREPIFEVPNEVKLPTDYFDDVKQKSEYNAVYADHYWRRFEESNVNRYALTAQRIRDCHKTWIGDHYKKSGVFNVKNVFHCHNRWCWLCTHIKQAKRLYHYELLFSSWLKDHDLYHIVFTVPNVKGEVLKHTLEIMQGSLKKLIRYFQGFGKIAGIDFTQYGFEGALRSFEIVIGPYLYHPHLHVLFLMKKGMDFPRTEVNKFSFNYGKFDRYFSEFEILLQKIFFLLVNGKKVTLENINALPIGYSCTADCVEGKAWHEVFKYATKMSKDGASTCTYEQFVLLDDILRRFKMIQGYGKFYDEEKIEDEKDPTAEILFEKVLILLNRKETPERDVKMELENLVERLHQNNFSVISKKMSYKYLQSIMQEVSKDMNMPDKWEPF